MSELTDRRRHARVDLVRAIFIQVVAKDGRQRADDPVIKCETVDVSVQGLRLLVPEPIEPGSRLDIAVPEEGWIENLELVGKARWIQQAATGEGYWLGLELQDTDRENMEKWFRIVNTLRGRGK
ncbi:MAG: PilZ domain-containing protein [Halioglobus sp.]|nr:PilZ domain-containing protein [Halioglobus sp.]